MTNEKHGLFIQDIFPLCGSWSIVDSAGKVLCSHYASHVAVPTVDEAAAKL